MDGIIKNDSVYAQEKDPAYVGPLREKLKEEGIFLTPAGKWTHNSKIVRDSIKNGVVPTSLHYAFPEGLEEWAKLEIGKRRAYNHNGAQHGLVSRREVQKKSESFAGGLYPFLVGTGLTGRCETELMLNSGINLDKIWVYDCSLSNVVSSSRAIQKAVLDKTGKKPEIYAINRLTKELPSLIDKERAKIGNSSFAFFLFGNINEQAERITFHDPEPLYNLSFVMKPTDFLFYTTHEFDEFNNFVKSKIKESYDTDDFWNFTTAVLPRFGIPIEGGDVGRFYYLDEEAMAVFHALTNRKNQDELLKNFLSEKTIYEPMQERVRISGLAEEMHFRFPESSATIWGLKVFPSFLSDFEKNQLLERCEKLVLDNPEKYGISREAYEVGERLTLENYKKLVKDKIKDLREENGPIRKRFEELTSEEKSIRALDYSLAIANHPTAPIRNLEEGVKNGLTGSHSKDAIKIMEYFIGGDRRRIPELKSTPTSGEGKVMIIDDDKHVGNQLSIILKSKGYETNYVSTPEDGLEEIKKNGGLVAIILDLNLPGIGGEGFLDEVNEMGYQTPVIVLTGYSSPDIVAPLMKKGAKEILTKPAKFPDIIRAINEHKLTPRR